MLALTSNVRVACTIAALMTCHGPIAAGEVLRIGGTGAANGMIKSVGALFSAETGIAIELVPGLGTTGANSALAHGVIDVAVAGRPLTSAEAAKGLRAVAEVNTPFGLVTSHPNPEGLKRSEIARLYQSDNPTWADGTPIRIILRPTADSDTSLLGDLFPGVSTAMAGMRKRADLSVAATDQDNADMVERTPGSLAGATLTQVETEKRSLRFVPIDGTSPSLENYQSGAYPLGKSLYFVLGAKQSPACERFLAFLRSSDGVAALRKAGVLLRPE